MLVDVSTSVQHRLHVPRKQTNSSCNKLLIKWPTKYSCKWEFDFQAGQPLPSSSNSRFQYKILEPTNTPALYSPVNVIDEENVSDAENCPQRVKMPVNVELKPLDESQEFVFPTIKSPKKVLKKTGKQIYSTPKKSRNTQLTEFMNYRKRRSVTAAKSSPFKSARNQHTNRAFASRRHSLAE
ncbi:hypothetical protein M3Y97_00592700 [Aphelenchoides bicaudatus]|nr:hypothetical protein M3Y97_00592700 [Aphelenchoides bicaudatus]